MTIFLPARSACKYCVQRRTCCDEQSSSIGTAEREVQGTLGNVDAVDQLSGRIVDIDLAGGDVDVPSPIDGYTFAALRSEQSLSRQVTISGDVVLSGGEFALMGVVEGIAWHGGGG